jgi:hypothetical protein
MLVSLIAIAMTMPLLSAPSMAARDKQPCVLQIGETFMQFSAYQAQSPGMRYCNEIPDVGPATIVLDQADSDLRQMATDIRIIRNMDEGTADGLLTDAAMVAQALDPITETHILPRTYPTGIIELNHTFTSPGQYHAIVIAKNDHGQVYVSQFPFVVGKPSTRLTAILGLTTALAAAGVLILWVYARRRRLRLG